MMRQRHVPVLCGSCHGPVSCQEDTCWRCGARVHRAHSSRREVCSRRRGRDVGRSAPAGSLRHPRCRPVAGPCRGGPSWSATRGPQPRGGSRPLAARTCGVPRPYQAGDAGARRGDRCRRRRLSPAGPSPRRVRHPPRCRARQALPRLNYPCAAAGFANSESASVWRAPRGTTITGQAASRTSRPATPPTMTACIGP